MSAVCVTLVCECAILVGCSLNEDIPAPHVSSVVPDHAAAGDVVMVNGDYFCQRPPSDDPLCDITGTVTFSAAPGTPTMWTDTSIFVEVPAGITGTVDLAVTARGRTSNTIAFTAN